MTKGVFVWLLLWVGRGGAVLDCANLRVLRSRLCMCVSVGMQVPLTGSSSEEHLVQDRAAYNFALPQEDVNTLMTLGLQGREADRASRTHVKERRKRRHRARKD